VPLAEEVVEEPQQLELGQGRVMHEKNDDYIQICIGGMTAPTDVLASSS
jgi:hypothetical protein